MKLMNLKITKDRKQRRSENKISEYKNIFGQGRKKN